MYYIFEIPHVCYTCGVWISRTSLVVQWLRLVFPMQGLIPGRRTKMLHAVWHSKTKLHPIWISPYFKCPLVASGCHIDQDNSRQSLSPSYNMEFFLLLSSQIQGEDSKSQGLLVFLGLSHSHMPHLGMVGWAFSLCLIENVPEIHRVD